MPSSWSTLKIELIADGEQTGTWGQTTNNNLGGTTTGSRGLEQAVVGMATLVTGDFTANSYTLPYSDTNDNQDFRALVLNVTATLSAAGEVIVPSIEKPYVVMNNSSGGNAVTVKTSAGTGITVPAGKSMWVYNNGTNVVDVVNHLTSLTLGTALPISSGGTGTTSTTFVNLTTNVTGVLPAANGGTGVNNSTRTLTVNSNSGTLDFTAASKTLGISNSITLAGTDATTMTFPSTNQTIAGLGVAQTFTAAQTFRATNAIRSEAASTQDAVIIAGRAGGTTSRAVTITPTTLSASRTLTLPDNTGTFLTTGATVTVGQGGTGATSFTANNVLLGNGSSAFQVVAPGTSGNILTSNGTTWTSAAPTGVTTGKAIAMAIVFG
jgi:hypothetical protein